MESKTQKLKESKVKLTVTVSPEEMKKHFQTAYHHLAPGVKIDGFRPGKAPRKLVEASLGLTRIAADGVDHAIQESYVKALVDNKLNPIAQPNISITKYPTYALEEDEPGDPLEYEAELEVFPEVVLGDYSKVSVKTSEAEKVKQEDMDKVLDHLRRQKSTFTDIDRPAQKGDFAEIDFEGYQKGVRVDQMSSKHHPLVVGEGSLIPGFEDQLVGMKKDEEKTFKIAFPKDYHAADLAGKEAEFKVKLNNLKEVQLPEINDEFAKAFGHDNVGKLESAIKESLQKEMDHKHEHEIEAKVIDALIPLLEAEIPESLVNQELDRLLDNVKEQVTSQGLNFEKYLESIKKTTDDIRKDLKEQAKKNVKTGLILGEVIKAEKIDDKDKDAGRKALDLLVKKLTK